MEHEANMAAKKYEWTASLFIKYLKKFQLDE